MWTEFRRLRKFWWFSFVNMMINQRNERQLSTCYRRTFCRIVSSNESWLLNLGMFGLDFKLNVTNPLNYGTCIHNTSLPVSWKTDTAPLQRPVYWWLVEKGIAFYCGDKNARFWQNSELLGPFAKSPKATASSCLSVRPQGTARPPVDGFSWNFTSAYFSKIRRENPSLIKISR